MVPVVDLEADDAETTPPSRKHVLLGDDVRRVNDGELPSIFAVETPFFDSSARSMNGIQLIAVFVACVFA